MTVIEREVAPEVLTEREQRARTLEAAALEVEVRGWTTGVGVRSQTGAVCIQAGIMFALGADEPHHYWPEAVFPWWGIPDKDWGALDDLGNNDLLWQFNDTPDRTADEVTFALRWRAEEIRDGR